MNVQNKKITELEEKLKIYREKLAQEMIGYRGVVHESSASEIKHDKVMVLKDMVRGLEEEIFHLKHNIS